MSDITAFWDLDGVVFKYEREAYVGENPKYARPKYFEDREIDARAYIELLSMYHNKNVSGLYILSRGATRLDVEKRKAVIIDKKTNVANRMPWFNQEHVIVADCSKVEAAEQFLGRKLCACDVLIDDFNENLKMWVRAGGSAIKYINGLNSPETYDGPKLIEFKLVDIPSGMEEMYEKLRLSIEA